MPKAPDPTWIEQLVNRRPAYFWWVLAYILSICFTWLSWSLGIAIFNSPEIPRNYEILEKLGRLPTLKNFTPHTAPHFSESSPPELRKSYLNFSDNELAVVNKTLLHHYLTNYKEHSFCAYLEGSYQVTASRKLTKDDLITQGVAVQFRAFLQPDEYNKIAPYPVVAEILFPTSNTDAFRRFKKGDMMNFNITPHFISLLHIAKEKQVDDDTIIRLSAVSLAKFINPPHGKKFSLSPPKKLNLSAKFPLFSGPLPLIHTLKTFE